MVRFMEVVPLHLRSLTITYCTPTKQQARFVFHVDQGFVDSIFEGFVPGMDVFAFMDAYKPRFPPNFRWRARMDHYLIP